MAGSADRDWETFGAKDPYFGVLSLDQFHGGANRETFFASGEAYIAAQFDKIRRHFDADFRPARSLDFGCGVGRLLIPLAARSREAVGIDISESMLKEARRNCDERKIANVTLIHAGDCLSALSGHFDLLVSYIVFQHIPVARGMAIVKDLLARLAPGGMGILHLTYGKRSRRGRVVGALKRCVPGAVNLLNVLKGRPFFAPTMQMNAYDPARLLRLLQDAGVRDCHVEFTDHTGDLGFILAFHLPR